jgi:subtilisin family serine protease
VPLRFSRPVMPVIATVIAAVWVVAGNAPAFADQVRSQQWWLSKLDVGQAWQESRGGGVTVAVLSDGVDAAHGDLAGAVTVGPDFTNSGETTSTFVGLQGTAIASLIAGRGHGSGNSSGVVGVAPRAHVLSVRVTLDPNDPAMDHAAVGAGLPDAIANGIRYAVAHHAKVIDLPVDPGEPNPIQVAALPIPPKQTMAPELTGITAAAGGSSAEKAAIAYAVHKGVVLVAPAGDNGAGTDAANFPAAYPGVIAVGGFDQNFVKGSYSSQQSYVALTAAGTGVIAASAHGGYTVVNSTSAASATVSGIAALIRARFPGLSAAQVANALTSSAVFQPIGGSSSGSGSGTADAGRALAAAAAVAAPADQRAGAGAVSGAAPTAPVAAPVASDGLAPRVLRAAIISAGALILLLLFVTAYAATGRRRERKVATDAKASAEWVRSTQNAYSPYGSGEADQMLEYFASPSNGPSSPADPFARIQGAQRAGSGSAGAQFPGAQFPGAQVPGAQVPGGQVPESQVAAGAGSDAGASGSTGTAAAASSSAVGGRSVGAWVPLGAGSRAQSRQPRVSGAPPWEPAAEPDSELPWAAVPGPAAAGRPRPASSAASPASDSIWPTTAPAAPASPPSDQAWANLAASAPSAVSAKPAAPTRSAGDEPAPADGPATAAFAPLAPFPSAAPGSAATPGPADPPASAGTLWQVRTTPRSPSGSDWELSDNEPARQAAAGQDPHRQQADPNAYQQPTAAEPSWLPSGGGTGWQSAAEQPPAAPAGEAWAAGGAWPAGETRAPGDTQAVGEVGSAGPDESASDADGAWDAQASGSSPHWLAAAVSERWQPSARSSPWQPSADTETGSGSGSAADSPRWGSSAGTPADPPRGSTAGAPATDSLQWGTPPGTPRDSAPWDATPESPRWESASEARRAESSPWQARHAEPAQRDAASESAARKAASAESRWGSGAADSGWNTTAEAPWQAASPEPRQDSAAGEDNSAAGGDDLFAWRPSAATETFPAVGDD